MRHVFSVTVCSTILLIVAYAAQLQAGTIGPKGPDAFGYAGNDIAYNLRDISASGTFLSLGDDSVSGALSIGFNFGFYGTTFSSTHVSSNGFLDFDGGSDSGCCSGRALPDVDGTSGGIIAGFWEDLNVPQGNIRYQTLGTVGSREFVVGFYDVAHYIGVTPVTFEMILHEGSGNIEFQYASAASDGGLHSIGIESPDETIGLQVLLQSSGTPLPLSSQGYLISTSAPAVPEPASVAVFGLCAMCIGFGRFRRLS